MLYLLSKIVPVHFTSTYRVIGERRPRRATWWQWRDRYFAVEHRPV